MMRDSERRGLGPAWIAVGSVVLLTLAAGAQGNDAVHDRVQRELDQGLFLGAAVVAGDRTGVRFLEAYGERDVGLPMRRDSIFDVSSLTKPAVVATTLAATLDRYPGVSLDDRAVKHLRSLGGVGSDAMTLGQLATHRSGLDNTKQYLQEKDADGDWIDGEVLMDRVLTRDVSWTPGSRTFYSDLGMIRLSEAIGAIHGKDFGEVVQQEVFDPLGMRDSYMVSIPSALRDDRAVKQDFRVAGVANNGMARRIGRAVGNAGLFTTAEDLAKVAEFWLNRGEFSGTQMISESVIDRFYDDALVWFRGSGGKDVPPFLSDQTISHTGFNGMTLIIDPELGGYVAVLSNWNHDAITTTNDAADNARRRIAAEVFKTVLIPEPATLPILGAGFASATMRRHPPRTGPCRR